MFTVGLLLLLKVLDITGTDATIFTTDNGGDKSFLLPQDKYAVLAFWNVDNDSNYTIQLWNEFSNETNDFFVDDEFQNELSFVSLSSTEWKFIAVTPRAIDIPDEGAFGIDLTSGSDVYVRVSSQRLMYWHPCPSPLKCNLPSPHDSSSRFDLHIILLSVCGVFAIIIIILITCVVYARKKLQETQNNASQSHSISMNNVQAGILEYDNQTCPTSFKAELNP